MSSSNAAYSLLFLCTGNSARSILAEFISKKHFAQRFDVYSAGASPKSQPHPMALTVLQEDYQIDTHEARSKSWDEFQDRHFDFVITLCDDAKEQCPVWPGQPVIAHWGMRDPSDEAPEEQRRAFEITANLIRFRMELLASLPIEKLDRLRLEAETQSIADKQS